MRPLEIWDAPTDDGAPLHARIGAPAIEARAAADGDGGALAARLLAETLVPFLGALQRELGFATVFLGGGLTLLPGFAAAFPEELPFTLCISSHGRFAAAPGGRRLLASMGCPRGVVVDVGQTAVKVSVPGRRTLVERDGPGEDVEQVADAIVRGIAGSCGRGLLLALPCEIDDALVPGASTYLSWEGDATLVPRLVRAVHARLPLLHPVRRHDAPVLVLNDAELVALSAACELPGGPLPEAGSVLAMTLGHGPGAALLRC